jgi:hypothetical protein
MLPAHIDYLTDVAAKMLEAGSDLDRPKIWAEKSPVASSPGIENVAGARTLSRWTTFIAARSNPAFVAVVVDLHQFGHRAGRRVPKEMRGAGGAVKIGYLAPLVALR